jgi:hypothetical protein
MTTTPYALFHSFSQEKLEEYIKASAGVYLEQGSSEMTWFGSVLMLARQHLTVGLRNSLLAIPY